MLTSHRVVECHLRLAEALCEMREGGVYRAVETLTSVTKLGANCGFARHILSILESVNAAYERLSLTSVRRCIEAYFGLREEGSLLFSWEDNFEGGSTIGQSEQLPRAEGREWAVRRAQEIIERAHRKRDAELHRRATRKLARGGAMPQQMGGA